MGGVLSSVVSWAEVLMHTYIYTCVWITHGTMSLRMSLCLFACQSVCLSVCLFVCFLIVHRVFRKGYCSICKIKRKDFLVVHNYTKTVSMHMYIRIFLYLCIYTM
jgi:uncharacterized protein HemY